MKLKQEDSLHDARLLELQAIVVDLVALVLGGSFLLVAEFGQGLNARPPGRSEAKLSRRDNSSFDYVTLCALCHTLI